MAEVNEQQLLYLAKKAAIAGGAEIMEVYQGDFEVVKKEDQSPLTIADQRSNEVIEKLLKSSGIPILSEEGIHSSFEERKSFTYLWIVDPLDGTKEFVKKNGEFTVNIALVENGIPILGVIYVPVKKWMYFGSSAGSYREVGDSREKLPLNIKKDVFTAVGSRSHPSKETADFFEKLKKEQGNVEVISMGSSLKICLVAEGTADVYPRFAPTMEWDTAAGHAIAKFAGKSLIDLETNEEMLYNRQQLRNNWFIVK